jgi:hypothetical protein
MKCDHEKFEGHSDETFVKPSYHYVIVVAVVAWVCCDVVPLLPHIRYSDIV